MALAWVVQWCAGNSARSFHPDWSAPARRLTGGLPILIRLARIKAVLRRVLVTTPIHGRRPWFFLATARLSGHRGGSGWSVNRVRMKAPQGLKSKAMDAPFGLRRLVAIPLDDSRLRPRRRNSEPFPEDGGL
jgi:hypothetical protein